MHNLFCDHSDLRNEADVEQIFARRLIEGLGYADKAIRAEGGLGRTVGWKSLRQEQVPSGLRDEGREPHPLGSGGKSAGREA